MNGKIVGGFIVLTALLAGGAIYYQQEYAYYAPVNFTPGDEIELTALASGQPEAIPVKDLEGIDATSSPLRFRACFTSVLDQPTLTEGFKLYDKAVPLNAPRWFTCFDAARIGAALESGEAIAFLSKADVAADIDAVVAVFPDGHGYAWHQLKPGVTASTGEE
ncbi:MAG: histidine kinase [Pseudorhodobacter sp.]|nr:histidine kinase [Pseudorhodobacter sp.]